MIVQCKCGKRRTSQPYKDARVIYVESCLVCKPARLNQPAVRETLSTKFKVIAEKSRRSP